MSNTSHNPPHEPGGGSAHGNYQPGMAPPPQSAPGVGQPADLMIRFVARLIDHVLLFVVNAVIVTVVVIGAIMGSSSSGVSGFGAADYTANVVSSLISAAITLGYFAILESSRGQTLGKMAMKLAVRGPGGGRPTLDEALKRNAFLAIGIIGIVPILGWILSPVLSLAAVVMIAVTISNDTIGRRGWHDRFAGGTSVVRTG